MLNLTSLRVRWEARRDDLRRLHAQVDGAVLIDELLGEVSSLYESQSLEPVTLAEASRIGGYSVDHLQRLVSGGQLENIGKKGRPRIRRGDLPLKTGHVLRPPDRESQFALRRRIVASVATHGEAS